VQVRPTTFQSVHLHRTPKLIRQSDPELLQVTPSHQYSIASTIPESVTMSATVERANGKKEPPWRPCGGFPLPRSESGR